MEFSYPEPRTLTIYGSITSTLVPILFSFMKVNIQDREIRLLRFLVISSFAIDVLSLLLARMGTNNLWLINFWQIIECTLITFYYAHVLQKKQLRWVFWAFMIFALIDLFYLEELFVINVYTGAVGILLCISYTIAYYYKLLNDLDNPNILGSYLFWVNTAFLFYFSGSLVVFTISNFLIFSEIRLMNYYSFTNILNILKNLVLAYSFWLYFKGKELVDNTNG